MARGAHYGPSPVDSDLPRKRRKVDDSDRQGHRKGPVYRDSSATTAQYRKPRIDRSRRNYEKSTQDDVSRPDQHGLPGSRQQSQEEEARSTSPNQVVHKNHKSKKERKENPSSRIHSLRKQLDRGRLPPTIKRERERELAALVFEQEKNRIRTERKKNLERYHFIRFIERQKATREVKKLKSLKKRGLDKEDSGSLNRRLHEAEVDLMYTQYAPLGEKYISLYASTNRTASKKSATAEDLALLDDDQRATLQQTEQERAKRDRTVVHNSGYKEESGAPLKPPRWYDVEAAMKVDDLSELNALRDEKTGEVGQPKDLVLGLTSKAAKTGEKRRSDWLDDEGVIDPADLDSESEADLQDGGVKLGDASVEENNEDDDMSDGDGGFFERH